MSANPPHSTFTLSALADRCVQCGLCLPSCPTYGLEALEAESPRGRITLIKAWDSGLAVPTTIGDTHLDRCLDCRRCEAVCPAGVEYGMLLTRARGEQRRRRAPGLRQRAVEWLTLRPRVLSILLRLYRRLWPLLPVSMRPLPRPLPHPSPASAHSVDSPSPAERQPEASEVAVFVGCVAREYEAGLRTGLSRLLAATGRRTVFPTGQVCCGALHAHAGSAQTASMLAATNREAFARSQPVLTLASGCHEAVADALGPGTRDAIAFLAEHGDTLRFAPRPERIALHLPCTQRNVVRSDEVLHALLARVPQLEVVPLDAGYGCCGAAGTGMTNDPTRAARFRQPLLDQLARSGAARLLSANIGCRLHLANGTEIPVLHPLEFLAECLASP